MSEAPDRAADGPPQWGSHVPCYGGVGSLEVPADADDAVKNSYTRPPANVIPVRSKNYLHGTEKSEHAGKELSPESVYEIVGFKVFHCSKRMGHIASKLRSLQTFIKENPCRTPSQCGLPDFLIVTWTFESFFSTSQTCAVHVFRRKMDFTEGETTSGLGKTVTRFFATDKETMINKLKFAFKVEQGSEAFRNAIAVGGGERPVIIAKRLTCGFHKGPNYFEIDQDVGSSTIASMLNKVILNASSEIIGSLSWMIEPQSEDELPERVLGIVRLNHINFEDTRIELDENYEPINTSI